MKSDISRTTLMIAIVMTIFWIIFGLIGTLLAYGNPTLFTICLLVLLPAALLTSVLSLVYALLRRKRVEHALRQLIASSIPVALNAGVAIYVVYLAASFGVD